MDKIKNESIFIIAIKRDGNDTIIKVVLTLDCNKKYSELFCFDWDYHLLMVNENRCVITSNAKDIIKFQNICKSAPKETIKMFVENYCCNNKKTIIKLINKIKNLKNEWLTV